jgi:hypothetical protein
MKMSPAAKTYLISGYPRSMRDVVEYSEKVNDEATERSRETHLPFKLRFKSSTVLFSYRGDKPFYSVKLTTAPNLATVSTES